MSAMETVRAALEALPATCRYHGDNVEDTHHLRYGPPPHACCETGRPALLRRLAEQALVELERPKPTTGSDRMRELLGQIRDQVLQEEEAQR